MSTTPDAKKQLQRLIVAEYCGRFLHQMLIQHLDYKARDEDGRVGRTEYLPLTVLRFEQLLERDAALHASFEHILPGCSVQSITADPELAPLISDANLAAEKMSWLIAICENSADFRALYQTYQTWFTKLNGQLASETPDLHFDIELTQAVESFLSYKLGPAEPMDKRAQMKLFLKRIVLEDWIGNGSIQEILGKLKLCLNNPKLIKTLLKTDYQPAVRLEAVYGMASGQQQTKEWVIKKIFGETVALTQLLKNPLIAEVMTEVNQLTDEFDRRVAPLWQTVREGMATRETEWAVDEILSWVQLEHERLSELITREREITPEPSEPSSTRR